MLGRHFQIVTDHNVLRWLHSMEPKGRLACWILDLQEFNFTVVHRAGRLHTNADALSRLVQSPGEFLNGLREGFSFQIQITFSIFRLGLFYNEVLLDTVI